MIVFLSILFSTSLVGAAESARYQYMFSYIYENKGEDPLTLLEEDVTIPLFSSVIYVDAKIVNSRFLLEGK
jgi:hypothetical protein